MKPLDSNQTRTVRIRDTVFESGEHGWCKHCGWTKLAHVIGHPSGNLWCKAENSPHQNECGYDDGPVD